MIRSRVWLASVVSALAFYAFRATHLPQRTAVGVEHRLFAGQRFGLLPFPESNRWLVTTEPSTPLDLTPASGLGERLAHGLWNLHWPRGRDTGRRLAPLQGGGTWSLEPLGLRRVWRKAAVAASADRYLFASIYIVDRTIEGQRLLHPEILPFSPAMLDVHTGRTVSGDEAVHAFERLKARHPVEGGEWLVDGPELTPESHGLEALVSPIDQEAVQTTFPGRVRIWPGYQNTPPRALYASSEGVTPRVLLLAERANVMALSRDGRTLYFERDNALWRLDLRRPLPELLDEAAPPPLPDPSH